MIKPAVNANHAQPMVVGLKAVAVVAVAWGAIYPALLWGLGALLP
ncbi:hypothetical protein [Roseateles sp.]